MRSWQSNRDAGNAYESYLAKLLGGDVVRGSGSGRTKGDLKVGRFLIQAKRTDRSSFSIHRADLKKSEEEALNQGRVPAFIIGFWAEGKPQEEWVAFPLHNWIQIIDGEQLPREEV